MVAGRCLVVGASGSGTTTLGRALAARWAVPHADADDYFWVPTAIPYTVKRKGEDRLRLMQELFLPRPAWVLSGSVMGWGEEIVERLQVVVFLTVDPTVRLARLHAREERRYGADVAPGGDRHQSHQEFLDWARGYDDPDFDGRNRRRQWLVTLPCKVIRLDAAHPVSRLAEMVDDTIAHSR